MNLENLYRWGKIKGINVIASADFTHPKWFAELQEKLEPAELGLYKLKDDLAKKQDKKIPESCKENKIRFILSVEISNIYKRADKVRKLHNVIIVPNLKTASKLNAELQKIGNIRADGRPILGMDSQDLLKITLEANSDNLFIPAHIWTPWFSMFGSKSGFDSIEEAFADLAPEIKVVETGLSSDPFMNWRLSALQKLTLVSNSDAHSPVKLGREANILNCDLDYFEIVNALKTGDKRFVGTIEFFPQEGKYHYDGHRACNVCFNPEETKKHHGLCPKCKKPLVVGVDYRVSELANHPEDFKPKKHKTVEYIIPLMEIIAEIEQLSSISSKKVQDTYRQLINKFGDEFSILRQIKTKNISHAGFPVLAEALKRMRTGKIYVTPGYDGVYGVIKVFKDKAEMKELSGQIGFGF
jgi:uncharacterized protein (TIGR00375 family)